MKKLFMSIACSLLLLAAFSQTEPKARDISTGKLGQIPGGDWQTSIPDCFCCNDKIYNLPSRPPITGPISIPCDSVAKYTTLNCPGASYTWSVSPAASFSGQGTNAISLNPILTAPSYTITVTIRCGQKAVSNSITVKVQEKLNCKPNYLLSTLELANGNYQVTGIPSVFIPPGTFHYWILEEVQSCPNGITTASSYNWNAYYNPSFYSPNPAITPGPSGNGYQYPGLAKGKCYRLTHYVYCCGQWKFQTKCFCLTSTANMRTMKESDLNMDEKTGDVDEKMLPKVILEQIKKIRN